MRTLPVSRRVSQPDTSWPINGAEVDRFEPGAGQFGIGPRGFADVADQPVEPDDVLADDVDQLLAQLRDPRSARGRRPPMRSEASGFFSSWVTSAANASILSIRWRSDWLMSLIDAREQADLVACATAGAAP